MYFVWCESVGNIFRDKILLRERMSDCVLGLVLLFCMYSFFLINMVSEKILFWKKVFMFNFSLKRISGNDLLWIIVMLWLLKVGVF